jgi:hypothetical protein
VRLEGHATHIGEMVNTYEIAARKPLEGSRSREMDNIKMDVIEERG